MLQSVEKNERRTKLKKYRGILLARISNNVLLHDHLTVGTHNPGEHRDTCTACQEYLKDKKEFYMVGELLACHETPTNIDYSATPKHYFYVIEDTRQNHYVIRAYNKEHALSLLEDVDGFVLARHPEQISKKEALDLVIKYEGQASEKQIVQYLRENEYYVGPIMSNLHVSLVANY